MEPELNLALAECCGASLVHVGMARQLQNQESHNITDDVYTWSSDAVETARTVAITLIPCSLTMMGFYVGCIAASFHRAYQMGLVTVLLYILDD